MASKRLKVYNKIGNRTQKESRMVDMLTDKLNEKIERDPRFTFEIANTPEELLALFNKHCIDDIPFTDMPNNAPPVKRNAQGEKENMTEPIEGNELADLGSNGNDSQSKTEDVKKRIDPMNREAPEIRGYVQNSEFQDTEDLGLKNTGAPRTQFDEPVTFSEQFEIPSEDINSDSRTFQSAEEKQRNKADAQQKSNASSGGLKSVQKEPALNPSFDGMDDSKKRRSAKRFSKYLVEAICALSSVGFEWWGTKDINEAKLTERELEGTINLNVLITLEDNQEVPLKHFFKLQCQKAKELSKYTDDEKKDLMDALTEVLLEKGVAPTPMQELMLTGLTMFAQKGILFYQMNTQLASIL